MSPLRKSATLPAADETVVDANARLPIVRTPEDFAQLIAGLTPGEQAKAAAWFSARRKADAEELARTRAAAQQRKKASPKATIVTPGCRKVPNYVRGSLFRAPEHYIKTGVYREYISPRLVGSRNEPVEYDVAIEDLEFISHQDIADKALAEDALICLINAWECATAFAPNPISEKHALEAAYAMAINCPTNFIVNTYAHWLQRRRDFGRPLLRRYWGAVPASSKGPAFNVFQTTLNTRASARRPKRTLQEQRTRLSHMREDLIRIQHLIEKVIERDRLKLRIGELNVCILDQMRRELVDQTYVSPYWAHLRKAEETLTDHRVMNELQSPSCRVVAIGKRWRPKLPVIPWQLPGDSSRKKCRQVHVTEDFALLFFDDEDDEPAAWNAHLPLLSILDCEADLGSCLRAANGSGGGGGTSAVGSKVSRRLLDAT